MSKNHSETKTHFRTCNLCEAMCGLEIEYQDREILSIRGDKKDPFSRGHICPKAYGLKDIYEDPDRLKMPLYKKDGKWEEIAWEEAYEIIVQRIRGLQEEFGPQSIGLYLGNPNAHNLSSMLIGPAFYRSLKTKNRFSATSVDQLPHHFASLKMFGHQMMIPIPDIDRCDYFLIMGANPLASNGSLMTAPDYQKRLKAVEERGGKTLVIDPRKSETAQKVQEHLFIRPGRDVYFLLAMLHCMFENQHIQTNHLEPHLLNIDSVADFVKEYSPEKVAALTGIKAEDCRRVSREFCEASSAVLYGRMGLSTQEFGTLCQWLINVINILSGNMDRPGGAMFTLPAFDAVGLTGSRGAVGSYNRWQSRVRELPEFGGELPVSALAEEILSPGDGQIRAMVTVAGNPILSTPNGRQLDQAFEKLDFMVSIDIYLNETTRHADIILPPSTGVENDHYDVVFHYLAIRNTAKFSPRLFELEEGRKADWEIFRELSQKFEAYDGGNQNPKKQKDPTKRLSPQALVDAALRYGPYGSKGHQFYGQKAYGNSKEGLKLQSLRQEVHGIDLGPLKPCLPQRLYTKDKKINLAPEVFVKDLDRVQRTLEEELSKDRSDSFLLIGRRHLRSNNSWMHNSKRLVRGKSRCTLMIHPEDAQKLHLEAGSTALVGSRVGEIEIEVELSEDMMPGVVSIPHGWGHDRPGVRWSTAQEYAGVSANDITDELFIDSLSGNAALSGVPVTVKALELVKS